MFKNGETGDLCWVGDHGLLALRHRNVRFLVVFNLLRSQNDLLRLFPCDIDLEEVRGVRQAFDLNLFVIFFSINCSGESRQTGVPLLVTCVLLSVVSYLVLVLF